MSLPFTPTEPEIIIIDCRAPDASQVKQVVQSGSACLPSNVLNPPSFPHRESLLMKGLPVVKERKRCHKDENERRGRADREVRGDYDSSVGVL